jgi:hypothetical protein
LVQWGEKRQPRSIGEDDDDGTRPDNRFGLAPELRDEGLDFSHSCPGRA